jgi:hypothetical protein
VVHFKYDLNINQNITYNSDVHVYFHETVTLCNELPSFFKQYTNIPFTEILKKIIYQSTHFSYYTFRLLLSQ